MASKANSKVQLKKDSKESKESNSQYRKVLLKRREELTESFKNHARELPETGLEGSAGDTSDHATADFTTEMFGVLLERQAGTLEEVERALKKLDNGEYGKCEACEKSIPAKRLKALPWARCCLDCQSKEDRIGAWKKSRAAQSAWEENDD